MYRLVAVTQQAPVAVPFNGRKVKKLGFSNTGGMTGSEPALILWGTFGIAVVSLVQPWLITGIRRLRERREIIIAEALRPEFFFWVPDGPGLGLYGTLFNKRVQTAVKQLTVVARRVSNNEQHRFTMRLFRKPPSEFTVASPFMIEPDSAYVYNVTLYDPESAREFEAISKAFLEGWNDFVRTKVSAIPGSPEFDASMKEASLNLLQECAVPGARFPQCYLDAFNALNRMFYWRAGEWELTLMVVPLDEACSYNKSWHVTLSADDERRMQLNVSGILATLAGKPGMIANFAAPEYSTMAGH